MRAIAVFAKSPLPGRVKTRLSPPLTVEEAVRVAWICLGETVRRVVPRPSVARGFLFLEGPLSPEIRYLASERHLTVIPQCSGDLGARLGAAFRFLQSRGARQVIAIGSDTPHLDPDLVRESFEALEENDLVIGPAEDGGYYLIGTRGPTEGIFDSIAWGTDSVFRATLDRARILRRSVGILPEGYDIDDAATLRRAAQEYGARLPALREVARLLER
jgi:uncharacterized protein